MPPGELNNQGCIPPWEGLRALDLYTVLFIKTSFPIISFNFVFAPGSKSQAAQQVVTSAFC